MEHTILDIMCNTEYLWKKKKFLIDMTRQKKLFSGLFYSQVIFSQKDVILFLAFSSARPIFQQSEGIVL